VKNWAGLDAERLHAIEERHGYRESAALRDVLLWGLHGDSSARPKTVAELKSHLFFDPQKGSMRLNFGVEHIKALLAKKAAAASSVAGGEKGVDGGEGMNVVISYSWSDSSFVISRLAVELAPLVASLWFDRLEEDACPAGGSTVGGSTKDHGERLHLT
jgi:hypothetical protein